MAELPRDALTNVSTARSMCRRSEGRSVCQRMLVLSRLPQLRDPLADFPLIICQYFNGPQQSRDLTDIPVMSPTGVGDLPQAERVLACLT